MEKIIVIVGPTASGKSAYAVDLALQIGGEVISADSRQIYKKLDIGTGKVTKKEMRGVPHHMLDVVSPEKVFTAFDYVRLARPILDDCITRGKTPIICGGTGFYIDALLGRMSLSDVPMNPELREKLSSKTPQQLYAMVAKKDPVRAAKIDPHNPVRLVRALEIIKERGVVPPQNPSPIPHHVEWIGLDFNDETLRSRIHNRLLSRMKVGLVKEAKKLHAQGLSYKRMEQLGLEYRYLARFLQKKMTKEAMLQELENDIWDYARRQRSYWRRNEAIVWKKNA